MITTETATATIAALTEKGRYAMAAIGRCDAPTGRSGVSFFDDGVTAGSGSWGECLTGDLGHKSSGVINRLAKLGLFEVSKEVDGAWFALTELGAKVARDLSRMHDEEAAYAAHAEWLAANPVAAPAASAEADLPLAEIMGVAPVGHVEIDLPGAFDSFFSGTGVAQGDTENDPALIALYSAYKGAAHLKRGRGYILRLYIPTTVARGVLTALESYADACIVANADIIAGARFEDPKDARSARSETAAARKVTERVNALLADLPDIRVRLADIVPPRQVEPVEAAPSLVRPPAPVGFGPRLGARDYRLSYPAAQGEPVTEGHATYCRTYGHAKHAVDGVDVGTCARCGEVTTAHDNDNDPHVAYVVVPGGPISEEILTLTEGVPGRTVAGHPEGDTFNDVRLYLTAAHLDRLSLRGAYEFLDGNLWINGLDFPVVTINAPEDAQEAPAAPLTHRDLLLKALRDSGDTYSVRVKNDQTTNIVLWWFKEDEGENGNAPTLSRSAYAQFTPDGDFDSGVRVGRAPIVQTGAEGIDNMIAHVIAGALPPAAPEERPIEKVARLSGVNEWRILDLMSRINEANWSDADCADWDRVVAASITARR